MKKLNKVLASILGATTIVCPIIATSCSKPKTPVEQSISWKDGWYAWQVKDSTGTTRSNTVDVEFLLAKPLETGQSLDCVLTETGGSEQCSIEKTVDAPIVVGQAVTITLNLKTTYGYMNIGDNREYDIEFTCTNSDGSVAWSQKVEDCFLCMLASLDKPTLAREAYTSGYEADMETMTSVNFETASIQNTIMFNVDFQTTGRSSGVPSTFQVVKADGQAYWYKSQRHLYQRVKWNEDPKGKVASGEYLIYSATMSLWLKAYPDKKYTVTYEDLRFPYRP